MNDEPEYARAIEAHLCRKNDGHLIRIVGPAFEQVCGWAARGIPLTIACHGIDRYFERYYAKGRRRRPVRVEFCDADVLDAFDEWRRAVGVTVAGPSGEPGQEDAAGSRPQGSLTAHLDRVIARLTALRAGSDRSLDDLVDGLVRELDSARTAAKGLRGPARAAFLDRLRALDANLLAAVRDRCGAAALQQCGDEADAELAAFRERMPPDAYAQSRAACIDRLLRERVRLPTIAYE